MNVFLETKANVVWSVRKGSQAFQNKQGHYLRKNCLLNCWTIWFLSQGRNPFFLEPSVIITITDGNKLTHSSGVPDEVREHWKRGCPLIPSAKCFSNHFQFCLMVEFFDHHACELEPLLSSLSSSCTCLWTLLWQAVNWPKSPFVGTSVCLPWCWGCLEQQRPTTSSSAASQQTSPPSPRCVKSLEVQHFTFTLAPEPIHYGSTLLCILILYSYYHIWSLWVLPFPVRAIVLCTDTEDVEPVSGISGPKGSKRRCNQFWEDGAWSTSCWGRWVFCWWCKPNGERKRFHTPPSLVVTAWYAQMCDSNESRAQSKLKEVQCILQCCRAHYLSRCHRVSWSKDTEH